MKPNTPEKRSGKRIAVVGSGPAGLTVAQLLNSRGHEVTVFERDVRPGGLLVYGIPSMKLPKDIVARRIALMEQEGIRFECGKSLGADLDLSELAQSFDAVVLALGAQKPRTVSFEGTAAGVSYALEYLGAAAKSYLGENDLPASLDARGKVVAVVGAGDTANDCIATALRQGASDVIQLIRRPASDYGPMNDYAHVEAEGALSRDIRRFSTKVASVQADESGTLREITLDTPEGPQMINAHLLIIASGFVGPEEFGAEGDALAAFGNVYETGDMAQGASLVVSAMAHAREIARKVDTDLTGYSTL